MSPLLRAEAVSELERAVGADVAELAAPVDWYHTQELIAGVETPGMFDLRPLVDRYGIPEDLSGLRVLEIGTFEGFWAFELERRGADVTALDIDQLQHLDWPPRARPPEDGIRGDGFRLVKELRKSNVRRVGISVYDATRERIGETYDLVFCGMVLIHLRDPMLALERMAALCHGRLILCEEYSRRLDLIPGGGGAEFRGCSPWMTWWRPNRRTWLQMVEVAGFENPREIDRFKAPFTSGKSGVRSVVIHADHPASGLFERHR